MILLDSRFQVLLIMCLSLVSTSFQLDPTCGNRFLDSEEECDCGTEQVCNGDGKTCCKDCKFVAAGTICRHAANSCDVSEYCNGKSAICPTDLGIANGTSCNNNTGYCYKKECRTHNEQCNEVWNSDVYKADDTCYELNRRGDTQSYCKKESETTYLPCAPENVQCGKLWCVGYDTMTLKYPGYNETIAVLNYNKKKIICWTAKIYQAPGLGLVSAPDLVTVLDGTKCGNKKVCKNNECVSLSVAYGGQQTCPNNCNGNGVCNENGNCHCNPGWKCPNCSEKYNGTGGSSDSGLDCKPVKKPPCQCTQGACCKNCQIVARGTICRDAVNSCDVSEYCNGTSEICPTDLKTANGISCDDEQGYCRAGECRTYNDQCNNLWSGGAFKADDACYEMFNLRGDIHGYCKEQLKTLFLPCAPKNVQCGKLWCNGNNTITAKYFGYQFYSTTATLNRRRIICRSVHIYQPPGLPNVDSVLDGTKCGNKKVCENNKCVSLSVAYGGQRTCPNNCNGNGVCNENGNCHCNPGWKCPNCSEAYNGTGGSSDSGLDCKLVKKTQCQCTRGACCKNCQIVARGTVCRDAVNSCDVPEYCNGTSEVCPADLKTINGISCYNYHEQGYCFAGECRTYNEQCNYLWFGGAFGANHLCYEELNLRGDKDGYCKVQIRQFFRNLYTPCILENSYCGKLWCTGNGPITGKSLGYGKYTTYNGAVSKKEIECRSVIVYQGQGKPPLGTVLDGTKCGNKMVCKDNKCVPLSVAYRGQPTCVNNCNGNGVCNENGYCHCNPGWKCPNCAEAYEDPSERSHNSLNCQASATTPETTVATTPSAPGTTLSVPAATTSVAAINLSMLATTPSAPETSPSAPTTPLLEPATTSSVPATKVLAAATTLSVLATTTPSVTAKIPFLPATTLSAAATTPSILARTSAPPTTTPSVLATTLSVLATTPSVPATTPSAPTTLLVPATTLSVPTTTPSVPATTPSAGTIKQTKQSSKDKILNNKILILLATALPCLFLIFLAVVIYRFTNQCRFRQITNGRRNSDQTHQNHAFDSTQEPVQEFFLSPNDMLRERAIEGFRSTWLAQISNGQEPMQKPGYVSMKDDGKLASS